MGYSLVFSVPLVTFLHPCHKLLQLANPLSLKLRLILHLLISESCWLKLFSTGKQLSASNEQQLILKTWFLARIQMVFLKIVFLHSIASSKFLFITLVFAPIS